MNWKELHTEATSKEREQILRLLARRIQSRAENVKDEQVSIWVRLKRVVGYWRGKMIRPRRSLHWIGKRSRLQRPERAFIFLMFVIAIILLEPYEYAVWATIAGGFTAMMVPVISVRYVLRAHWVK
jgi:hypothetical protein